MCARDMVPSAVVFPSAEEDDVDDDEEDEDLLSVQDHSLQF